MHIITETIHSMESTSLVHKGEDFSPNESLTRRLNGLVHDYPEGIGIFKELLQNADDAGAKRIKFVLDWQTHSDIRLKHPSMTGLLGSSMLVFNDAVFREEDFEGLKNLGKGGKSDNLRKTGRFGLGFNSVYNMSDHPSFISGDNVCFFDPHRSSFPCADTGRDGEKWLLSDFRKEEPNYLDVFEAGGLEKDDTSFEGTLFRFPFRTIKQAMASKICSTAFTRERNAEPLLNKLIDCGEELLLFLKSIEEIEVVEIEVDGTEQIRLCVRTLNASTVSLNRRSLLSVLNNKTAAEFISFCRTSSTSLPQVSYIHQIQTVARAAIFNSTWRIVQMMQAAPGTKLIETMATLESAKEKAVPWAGAAARIISDRPTPVEGKQYCFLPLPESTGLPIHIHGYFDLDSSRQGSTREETTGNAAVRSKWNELLTKHVVVPACARLIADLVLDLGNDNPAEFYRLWPVYSAKLKLFENLANQFLAATQNLSVIRSNLEGRWVKPIQISRLPDGCEREGLFAPLTADKICLPEPVLPPSICTAFDKAKLPIKKLTPDWVRTHLIAIKSSLGVPVDEVSQPSLQKREWVVTLLRYCLSDGYSDLSKLPLALMSDGTLQRFSDGDLGCVYLAHDLQRRLFESNQGWFLDTQFQAAFPELREKAMAGVQVLTPARVVERLLEIDCWEEDLPQSWEPYGEILPNAAWIRSIYQYFSTVDSLPDAFAELPIVPGRDGYLHTGGENETPLWSTNEPSQTLKEALSYFNISLVSTEDIERTVFEKFLKQHPFSVSDDDFGNSFIWPLTACNLIDTLYAARRTLPDYQADYYSSILAFLSGKFYDLSSGEAKKKLNEIPIFPTLCGRADAAADPNVYLPEADLPNISLNVRLLKQDEQWRRLLQLTSVQKLSIEQLISRYILTEYKNWGKVTQIEALEWVRTYLPQAIDELRRYGKDYKKLVQAISEAPLIHCTDGRQRAAQAVYHPNSRLAENILGQDIPTPDMSRTYSEEPELWLSFFNDIGLLTRPRPQDLFDYAGKLNGRCKDTSIEEVSESCLKLLYYINDSWEELSTAKVKVAEVEVSLLAALKDKAWLPIETNPKELEKYPGASQLGGQNHLRRADEIAIVQDANYAASQRPFLRLKRLLRGEVSEALGFRRATMKEVFNHFEYLIELWETDSSAVKQSIFGDAINRVYGYLSDYLKVGSRNIQEFKMRFSSRKCLWDNRGHLWKPQHVFERNVSYFGKRRFGNEKGKFENLYRLLGQKQYVAFRDFNDFLEEVRQDYGDRPVSNEQEVSCVIEVLNRMSGKIAARPESGSLPNLLLTEDLYLLPPNEIVIPDAAWRVQAVRDFNKAKLLHPKVDRLLADIAGSPSLLRNIKERATGNTVIVCEDNIAMTQAQTWQSHLRSPLFKNGLMRLILDSDLSTAKIPWIVFKGIQVNAAEEIYSDLFWGTRKVASNVKGDAFFDEKSSIIHVRYDKAVGVDYLADCLNNRLEIADCALADKSKLIHIIQADPAGIDTLLDSLRVRSLKEDVPIFIEEPGGEEATSAITEPKIEESASPKTGNRRAIKIGEENSKPKPSDFGTSRPPTISGSADRKSYIAPNSKSFVDKPKASSAPIVINIIRPKLTPSPNSGEKSESKGGSRSKPTDGRPGGRNDRWKTVVYPTHDRHFDEDAENLTQTVRANVEMAGIQRVLGYEKQRQRQPKEMLNNNPGYDIKSTNIDGSIRYIEVKSFRWNWSGSGAKLSTAQFRMAQKEGESFWLYIVERAEENREFKIHRIQDPANRVKDFYFDDGWKQISAAEDELADLLML